jgi:hypothetical protein
MNLKNSLTLLIALSAIVAFAGCAPMVYVNPRQLTVDEIISMSSQGVGKDIIIQHINSTHSSFKLSAEDVVKLTQAKVDPDVIKAMIKSEDAYQRGGNYSYGNWGSPFRNYPYWNNPYYYYYFWYDYPGYYNFYRPYFYRSYSPFYYRGYDGRGYGGYGGSSGHRGGGGSRGGMGRR